MSSRCASDIMSGHLYESLGRESYKECGSDDDISMSVSGFVAPVEVNG